MLDALDLQRCHNPQALGAKVPSAGSSQHQQAEHEPPAHPLLTLCRARTHRRRRAALRGKKKMIACFVLIRLQRYIRMPTPHTEQSPHTGMRRLFDVGYGSPDLATIR